MSVLASTVSTLTTALNASTTALTSVTTISKGSSLPDFELKVDGLDEKVNLGKLEGKNVVLTVPAAFSPSCSDQVPVYIEKYDEFIAKGVKAIYVVSVNDGFAMKAWKSKLAGEKGSKVFFVADDSAVWGASTGLLFDATPFLGGPRLKRSAIVTSGSVVESIAVEATPPEVTVSSADSVLATL